ncbi:MAG TPA: ABC transporter ATP-binding protein [Mycobacteriales bacterium]
MSLDADIEVRRGAFALQVSLTCAAGETLAVLGPNGAGKSTLLRALAGLEPAEGSVSVAGRDVSSLPPRLRGAGVVFQDHRLFPHLSARDNVAFGPRSRGRPRRETRAEADALLVRLGLASLGGRRPRELSGGQAQRVALARALAGEPTYLLLDEPLSALDAEVRAEVRSFLRTTVDGYDGPCLLVTHDAVEALTLADRILVLEGGRVVQEGTPAAIARQPATPYVARLVGLNLYRGELQHGRLDVVTGGAITCATGTLHGSAVATIRPSAVTLFASEPHGTSARNVWRGRIAAVEVAGERVRVELASTPRVIAEVTAGALAELRVGAGDDVWAAIKATDVDVRTDV